MAVQIQVRRGDASLWTSTNPILAEGEIAVELDTHRWKIGDGTTAWNVLPYASDLEVLTIVGSRTYTEQNYVTNSESVTDSIDALDTNLNLVDNTFAAHLAESASKHIKESGSNANGNYIKFDDGTMICKGAQTFTNAICNVAYQGGFRGSVLNNVIVFPASFINTTISFSALPIFGAEGAISFLRGNISVTETSVAPFRLTSSDALTFQVDYIAIGRWK